MITLGILTVVAFVLLTTLIEMLSGLSDNESAIIAGGILGVAIIVLVLFRCLLRRARATRRIQIDVMIHNGRIKEECDKDWGKRNRTFFRRRGKEIVRIIDRGESL